MKKVISKLYQSLPSITNKLQVYYMHELMVAIAEANCRVLCRYVLCKFSVNQNYRPVPCTLGVSLSLVSRYCEGYSFLKAKGP